MAQAQNITFPIEIWRNIFEQVYPVSSRTHLMYICRALYDEARAARCRTVHLQNHDIAKLFYCCIIRAPSIATSLRELSIKVITGWDGMEVPAFVPVLFSRLINLEILVLHFYTQGGRTFGVSVDFRLDPRWFPGLRKLSTCLPPSYNHGLYQFLRTHPRLTELHIADSASIVTAQNPATFRAPVKLPALKVVSCDAEFLSTSIDPSTVNITHMGVYAQTNDELLDVAEWVGDKLVSLRIWCRTGLGYHFGAEPWMVDELRIMFPLLRFVEVDVCVSYDRRERVWSVSTIPIDWEAASSDATADTIPPHKIIVKWSVHVQRAIVHGTEVGGWDECVRASARRVLKQWRDIESIRVSFVQENVSSFSIAGEPSEETTVASMRTGEWKHV